MDVAGVHTDSEPDTEGSSGLMSGSEETPPVFVHMHIYSGAVGAAMARQQINTHTVEFTLCTELTQREVHTVHRALTVCRAHTHSRELTHPAQS